MANHPFKKKRPRTNKELTSTHIPTTIDTAWSSVDHSGVHRIYWHLRSVSGSGAICRIKRDPSRKSSSMFPRTAAPTSMGCARTTRKKTPRGPQESTFFQRRLTESQSFHVVLQPPSALGSSPNEALTSVIPRSLGPPICLAAPFK